MAQANVRLAIAALYSGVDATQCSWVRKADSMVLLKLRKAVEDVEWESLDDSTKAAAKKKEEKLRTNKEKSTRELLSEMYANADEAGKESLAKAWDSGRGKREGKLDPV